jgi:RND family efflux transporter MFP subunit
LQDGAFFAAGDLLINLDNRDFQSAINSAKAELTQAQQALTLEKAQVVQAKADWERLNKAIPIPALVSRKPQVVSAKAKVSAALAQFDKALLNFKRTKIYAPFNGRVLNKKVNMGDFISANSTLVEFIASDFLQVRLSLKNSDLAFINLPETGLSNTLNKETLPKVLFESRLIEPQFWNGQIVRTEASIDQSSQQLFVIGEIEAPFGPLNAHKHSLKIGQYITAKIQGKLLKNVISINVDTLHQGQYVYIVKNGLITKTAVDISWQNEKIAIISMGLSIGDKLITSTVSADSEGSQASTGTGTGVGKTKDKKAFKKLNP